MRFTQTLLYLCVPALLAVATLGCGPDSTTDAPDDTEQPTVVVNTTCPIMGGEVTEAGGSVDWNGKAIGFCCDGCDEKWQALSEDEKSEKLAKAQAAKSETAHEHDHAEDRS